MTRGRSALILVVAVVVTAVVAVAAITATRRNSVTEAIGAGGGGGSSPGSAVGSTVTSPRPDMSAASTTTSLYDFPADYVGTVWVSLAPPTSATEPQEVVISWGEWQCPLVAAPGTTTTYSFTKNWDPSGPSPSVVAGAAGPVTIEFGTGDPPAGAIDSSPYWTAIDPGTSRP